MHFASALFSVLCALTLTLNSALAANICTYASRGCGGSSACCNNIPAGNCCWWSSASLGWSVRMSSMTGSWHAACYGSQSCTNQMASISVGGSTVCASVPNSNTSNWHSAGWNWNSRVIQPDQAAADWKTTEPVVAPSDSECRQPNSLGYTWSNRQYQIDVPEGQFDHLSKLLEDGNYEALNRIATEVKA
ncbi:hypothetical protein MD484_g8481, partial [Candolleomyces efflorescens]